MPGVLPPNNEYLASQLGELFNRVRALETQQQQTYTNALAQVLITLGLVPGSNPAEYGLQLLNPSTGAQEAFLGEDASGNAVFNVTGTETVTGTLNVTGDMIVGGTLSLPNGIINNAALTAPVYPQTAHAQAANFALTTTATEYVRATITVPSGYSQALVFAAISANARNKNTVQDYLDGYVDIFGKNSGLDSVADGAPGYSIGISNSGSALLTGLGSSFWIRGMLLSGAANWAADSFNGINVDAIILFLR